MKKIVTIIFLIDLVSRTGFGYFTFEVGTFKEKERDSSVWSDSSAVVVPGDLISFPSTFDNQFQNKPQYSNARRLFYIDGEGFVVVGEKVSEDFASFFPMAGDLVVDGRVLATDVISPRLDERIRFLGSENMEQKREITELRSEISELKERLKKLEERR